MNQQNLWAPWRTAYVNELARRVEALGGEDDAAGDFFAAYWAAPEDDERNCVVWRGERGLILLNRYPYANGHLLVALGEARPSLMEYGAEDRAAFWSLVELGFDLMQRALAPQGINMGINQGHAAGAGVPEHLHAHLVPRWGADTNFISVVGQVRVIPDSMERMAEAYRKAVEEVETG